jgi:hypothetical protein
MKPGPDIIVACPRCGHRAMVPTLMSGNTFGARHWTDGYVEAPMLPRQPPIAVCRKCRHVYWWADTIVGKRGRGTLLLLSAVLVYGAPLLLFIARIPVGFVLGIALVLIGAIGAWIKLREKQRLEEPDEAHYLDALDAGIGMGMSPHIQGNIQVDEPQDEQAEKPQDEQAGKPQDEQTEKPQDTLADKPQDTLADKPQEPLADKPQEPLADKLQDTQRERTLRMHAWWLGNNPARGLTGGKPSQNPGAPLAPRSARAEASLRRLYEMLDQDKPDERLLRAEIARELGDFERAEADLAVEFPAERGLIVARVRELTALRDTRVGEIISL